MKHEMGHLYRGSQFDLVIKKGRDMQAGKLEIQTITFRHINQKLILKNTTIMQTCTVKHSVFIASRSYCKTVEQKFGHIIITYICMYTGINIVNNLL
jgi:hypothetical protein